jgi:hypothetical protein
MTQSLGCDYKYSSKEKRKANEADFKQFFNLAQEMKSSLKFFTILYLS